MSKPIFIIRHGRTVWNNEGKLQGWKNSPLLEESIVVARTIARYLVQQNAVEKIYCSPLRRCIETAEIIGNTLAIPCEIRDEIKECNMGKCEGLTWQEAEEKFPKFFEERVQEKWNVRWPEGESYEDVFSRAEAFLRELSDDKGVLIVGHEMFNKCFVGACMDWQPEKIMEFRQANHELIIMWREESKMEILRFGGHA